MGDAHERLEFKTRADKEAKSEKTDKSDKGKNVKVANADK